MSLRRRSAPEGSFLDLTPCSDIIFTLLLFYILTQSFLSHLPLQLPRLTAGEDRLAGLPQRLAVTASGTVMWNGSALRPNWEAEVSARARGLSSATAVVLLAHPQAPAGVVIELLDRLRGAGIQRVAFGGQFQPKVAEGAAGGP